MASTDTARAGAVLIALGLSALSANLAYGQPGPPRQACNVLQERWASAWPNSSRSRNLDENRQYSSGYRVGSPIEIDGGAPTNWHSNRFRLVNQPSPISFYFNEISGQIHTYSERFDHEQRSSYPLSIEAWLLGGPKNVQNPSSAQKYCNRRMNQGCGDCRLQTITVNVSISDEPERPERPRAPRVAGVHGSLTVSWDRVATNPEIGSYDVQYRAGPGGPFLDGPQGVTGTSSTIENLNAHFNYQVRVLATNSLGDSEWSATTGARTTPPPADPDPEPEPEPEPEPDPEPDPEPEPDPDPPPPPPDDDDDEGGEDEDAEPSSCTLVAPYWSGASGGFTVMPAPDRTSVRVTCGGTTTEYPAEDGLVTRLLGNTCPGSGLRLTGAAPGGWYWQHGEQNAAVSPFVCSEALGGPRAVVPGGVTADVTDNGTWFSHDTARLVGIVPHLAGNECSQYVTPYWQGEGGVVVRPAEGRPVGVRVQCGTTSSTMAPSSGGDGLVVELVKKSYCTDDEGNPKQGRLTVTGADPGGWYWISGERNAAVGPLVCADLLGGPAAVDPGGVTSQSADDGTYFSHDTEKLIGVVPHVAADR